MPCGFFFPLFKSLIHRKKFSISTKEYRPRPITAPCSTSLKRYLLKIALICGREYYGTLKRSSEIVYKMFFFGLLSTVDNYLIYVLNCFHHIKKA